MTQTARETLETLHAALPHQVTEAMVGSDALQRVVQYWIDDPDADADKAILNMTLFLSLLRLGADRIIEKEIRTPHNIDQEAAVDAIRNAARHVSPDNPNYAEVVSGSREQLERMRQEDPSIMDLSRPENLKRLAERNLLHIAIDAIAVALEGISDAEATPGMMRSTPFDAMALDPDNLKAAGGAHDREGAMRGFIVRELDRMIPGEVENRYATIRHLAALAGVDMDKSYARSLLHGGRT